VFVTAHETYALHAFAAGALDYLVKPVDVERLAEAVRRVGKMTQLLGSKGTHADESLDEDGNDDSSARAGAARLGPADVIHVPLPTKGQAAVVTVGDICWVEGLRNFTRVGLRNPGRIELFKQRLGEWERQLSQHLFARLGKSFLVQVPAITQLESKSRDVTLVTFTADLEPLVIGRLAATRLREILSRGSPTPESPEA
jgi:two-component system LytT family response regulator